jgi:hypothetical protein
VGAADDGSERPAAIDRISICQPALTFTTRVLALFQWRYP